MAEREMLISKRSLGTAMVLMLAGFCCGAALLHSLVLHPLRLYGAERSEKLVMLQRDHYNFNAAAFGSSHVHLGFDPREFDASVAGALPTTHSVNLGLNGGSQVEQRVMAMNFVEHLHPPPSGPCLLFLEVTAPPDFTLQLASNPRSINIYDWHAEALAAGFRLPYLRRLKWHIRATSYLTAFEHAINLGMLSNRIFAPPLLLDRLTEETSEDRRGFDFEPPNAWGSNQVAQVFAKRVAAPEFVSRTLESGNLRLVQDVQGAATGNRPQLIWVVMPLLRDLTTTYLYPTAQQTRFGEVPILNLARPDLYPALYKADLWADDQHLTQEGAHLFTRYLAQATLELVKEQRIRKNCGD